jgi:hypothetical protein
VAVVVWLLLCSENAQAFVTSQGQKKTPRVDVQESIEVMQQLKRGRAPWRNDGRGTGGSTIWRQPAPTPTSKFLPRDTLAGDHHSGTVLPDSILKQYQRRLSFWLTAQVHASSPSYPPILFSSMVPALEVWFHTTTQDTVAGPPHCLLQHARVIFRFLAETFDMGGASASDRYLIDMIVDECEFM